jgi:predicted membrane protein
MRKILLLHIMIWLILLIISVLCLKYYSTELKDIGLNFINYLLVISTMVSIPFLIINLFCLMFNKNPFKEGYNK